MLPKASARSEICWGWSELHITSPTQLTRIISSTFTLFTRKPNALFSWTINGSFKTVVRKNVYGGRTPRPSASALHLCDGPPSMWRAFGYVTGVRLRHGFQIFDFWIFRCFRFFDFFDVFDFSCFCSFDFSNSFFDFFFDLSKLLQLRNAPKTLGHALESSVNAPKRPEMSGNVRKSPKIIRKRPKIIRNRPKIIRKRYVSR